MLLLLKTPQFLAYGEIYFDATVWGYQWLITPLGSPIRDGQTFFARPLGDPGLTSLSRPIPASRSRRMLTLRQKLYLFFILNLIGMKCRTVSLI